MIVAAITADTAYCLRGHAVLIGAVLAHADSQELISEGCMLQL